MSTKNPAQAELTRPIVLTGMMGAGKSTIAKRLATRLGVPCADSDAEIEAATRRTIAELFARDGEAKFRAIEAEIAAKLLAELADSGQKGILALGGGALMTEKTRALMAENAILIWLKAAPEILRARISADSAIRPLLAGGDKYAILDRLCTQREPIYAQADIIIDAAPPAEQIMELIISTLRTRHFLRP